MSDYTSIDAALNIDSEIVKVEKDNTSVDIVSSGNDIKKDYEYTRANLYSLIEKGQEAIKRLAEFEYKKPIRF